MVWKLDRLARSLRQLIDTVETLNAGQIGFRSLTEAIDTTTPGGKLICHIFGALAEFERSVIRERTQAGLAAARARGRQGGRPPMEGHGHHRRQSLTARPQSHRRTGGLAAGRCALHALPPYPWWSQCGE